MSRIDFRRFARPDALKAVEPSILRAFLQQDAAEFLAPIDLTTDPLDIDAIATRLATPTVGYPVELAEALYFGVEFGRVREALDTLWERAREAGLIDSASVTPSQQAGLGLVLSLWSRLAGRQMVMTIHAELCTTHPRAFESFEPVEGLPYVKPNVESDAAVDRFRANIDAWFHAKRGVVDGVKVFRVVHGAATWLLIRLPAPWERRTYVQDGGAESTRQGHPEDYDVLIYTPEVDELAVHTSSRMDAIRYREAFGECFCDDRHRFRQPVTISLEPLKTLGRESLRVHDVEGIHEITLVEVCQAFFNENKERHVRKATDLFLAIDRHPLSRATITMAGLSIVLRPDTPADAVRIYAGGRTTYARDAMHDGIRTWMDRRGFTQRRSARPTTPTEPPMTWPQLVAEVDTVASAEAWQARLAGSPFAMAAVLRPTGKPAPTAACGRNPEGGCRRSLHGAEGDGRPRYRCGREPVGCDSVTREVVDATGQRVDLDALVGLIAIALRVNGDPRQREVGGARLWHLGKRPLGATDVPFWFSTAGDDSTVAAAVAALRLAHPGVPQGLWLPTTVGVSPAIIAGAQHDRVGIVGIDASATDEPDGLRLDLWPVVHGLRHALDSADPTEFCGDRFDLVLDPALNRYWYQGNRVRFTPRMRVPQALLEVLATLAPAAVNFATAFDRRPDEFPAGSRKTFRKHQEHLAVLMAKARSPAHDAADAMCPLGNETWRLAVDPARILWWSRRPSDPSGVDDDIPF